jgi:hypothetical protein
LWTIDATDLHAVSWSWVSQRGADADDAFLVAIGR